MPDSSINKAHVDCRLKGHWFESNPILVSHVVFHPNTDLLGTVYSYMQACLLTVVAFNNTLIGTNIISIAEL